MVFFCFGNQNKPTVSVLDLDHDRVLIRGTSHLDAVILGLARCGRRIFPGKRISFIFDTRRRRPTCALFSWWRKRRTFGSVVRWTVGVMTAAQVVAVTEMSEPG
jgi:hypothetical protein